MKTATAGLTGQLNFPSRIRAFLGQAEKYATLCPSPKRIEFQLCALLAAWESISLQDSEASHWFELWQKHCRTHHHGKTRRTLADPVEKLPLAARWHIPALETTKAHLTVKGGLRRVFRATLDHYSFPERDGPSLMGSTATPAILFEKIRASFKTGKSFACPEGLEIFLLTLIELFEQSLGTDEDDLFSHAIWLSEIRRRRLGGPPETRTLADVAAAEVRLNRQNALPEKERIEILRNMVSSMRRIMKELQSYLEKRTISSIEARCK
jgi:hypothetical protein